MCNGSNLREATLFSNVGQITQRCPIALEQTLYFYPGVEHEVIRRALEKETMLTAYFKLNAENASAREYFYFDIPLYLTWYKNKKQPDSLSVDCWNARKNKCKKLSRIRFRIRKTYGAGLNTLTVLTVPEADFTNPLTKRQHN